MFISVPGIYFLVGSLYLKSRLNLQNWKKGASRLNIADFSAGLSRAASLDEQNSTYFKKHFYSNFSVGFPVELINLRGLEIKRIWKVRRIWFSESCIHLPFVVRNRTRRRLFHGRKNSFYFS